MAKKNEGATTVAEKPKRGRPPKTEKKAPETDIPQTPPPTETETAAPITETAPSELSAVVQEVVAADVKLDPIVQPRESVNATTVEEYQEDMKAGVTFPPIVVFQNPDTGEQIVADGWHRVLAARAGGIVNLPADIRDGTLRDAILYSVGANAGHGLRRTDADKRKAVNRLLDDEKWTKLSATQIASLAKVSVPLVIRIRNERGERRTEVTDSRGRTMDTSSIGRKAKAEKAAKAETAEPTPLFPTTNGTAHSEPIAIHQDDTAAPVNEQTVETDANVEPPSQAELFGEMLLNVMENIGNFGPAEVFAALGATRFRRVDALWDDFIDKLDVMANAMPAAQSAYGPASADDSDADDEEDDELL